MPESAPTQAANRPVAAAAETGSGSMVVDQAYHEHREAWERDALGQWVAIRGPDFSGPCATVRLALTAGRERFGRSAFTIVRIGERRRTGDLFTILRL